MEKMNEAKASLIKKVLANEDVIEAVMGALEDLDGGFVPFGLTDEDKTKLMAVVFDQAKDVKFDCCDTDDVKKVKAKYAAKGYSVLYTLDNDDSTAFAFVKRAQIKEATIAERARVREGIISSKDGDKTFDQLYGAAGVQSDEADEEWAQAFSHCFESTSTNRGKTRLQEGRAKRLGESDGRGDTREAEDYARVESRILDIIDDLQEDHPRETSLQYERDTVKEMWNEFFLEGSWSGFVKYLEESNSRLIDNVL